jgi:hypothetical protein
VERGGRLSDPGLGISKAHMGLNLALSIWSSGPDAGTAPTRAFPSLGEFEFESEWPLSTMENPSPSAVPTGKIVKGLAIRAWLGKIRGAAGGLRVPGLSRKQRRAWGKPQEYRGQLERDTTPIDLTPAAMLGGGARRVSLLARPERRRFFCATGEARIAPTATIHVWSPRSCSRCSPARSARGRSSSPRTRAR